MFLEVLHLLLGVGDDRVGAGLPARRTHLAVLVGVLRERQIVREAERVSWVSNISYYVAFCMKTAQGATLRKKEVMRIHQDSQSSSLSKKVPGKPGLI